MNIDIDLGYQGNVVVFDLDDTLYKECDYVASAYNAIDKYLSEHYNIQSKECFATMENAFKNKANPFDKLFEMFKFLFSYIFMSFISCKILLLFKK